MNPSPEEMIEHRRDAITALRMTLEVYKEGDDPRVVMGACERVLHTCGVSTLATMFAGYGFGRRLVPVTDERGNFIEP